MVVADVFRISVVVRKLQVRGYINSQLKCEKIRSDFLASRVAQVSHDLIANANKEKAFISTKIKGFFFLHVHKISVNPIMLLLRRRISQKAIFSHFGLSYCQAPGRFRKNSLCDDHWLRLLSLLRTTLIFSVVLPLCNLSYFCAPLAIRLWRNKLWTYRCH